MLHGEGEARAFLECVATERRRAEQRAEVFQRAVSHLESVESAMQRNGSCDQGGRQALGCLRDALGEARALCVEQWQRQLESWSGALEALNGRFAGLLDLAALGELSASVAHEIRNPLCGILLSLEVLQTKMDAEDSRNTLITNVHREALKMERVVNNLLHFARHYQPRAVLCELSDVVLKTIDSIKTHLQKRQIEVRVRRSALRCEAEVDPELVQQVFRNILLNSVDACPKGSCLDVDLGLAEGEAVAVAFTDCGEGIQQDRLARIFDPFYTSKTTGVGLGLSVSKKIVDAHHGRISVESEVGRGTRFTVVLPSRAEGPPRKVAA
jgi:signal transduction histidine kinase